MLPVQSLTEDLAAASDLPFSVAGLRSDQIQVFAARGSLAESKTDARMRCVGWNTNLTDQGLVVPVLEGADRKSLDELAAEAARLAEGARAGSLAPKELKGSTFTVTSAGRLGGLFATPLVNHPEVGILGLHRIASRPTVVDGELVAREIGWLSCTFDHRVVDGARASEFLLAVIGRLQAP